MKTPRFGDIIENTAASPSNPRRFASFVRAGRRTGKLNPGPYYELTDRNGDFWTVAVTHRLINHGASTANPTPHPPSGDHRSGESGERA